MMTHIMKNDSMKNPAVVETVETQNVETQHFASLQNNQPNNQPQNKLWPGQWTTNPIILKSYKS